MFGAVVCIDMGSSYTKISTRTHGNEDAKPVGDPSDPSGRSTLIPSIVAEIKRAEGARYLFGAAAAAQRGGQDVRRFRNWKSTLLTSRAPQDPTVGHAQAVRIAVRFLSYIKKHVLVPQGLSDLPVRLCAPEVEGNLMTKDDLAALLVEAGMSPAECIPVLEEPAANAIGVLTRGRNRIWLPRRQSHQPIPTAQMSMQEMFEPSIGSRYRQNGLAGLDGTYNVLITDLGAYTTDFALVSFETGFGSSDFTRPLIHQESCEIGIAQLDRAIYDSCSAVEQRAVAATSLAEWEEKKRALYQGEPIALIGPDRTKVGLGAESAKAQVELHAEEVLRAKRAFLGRLGAVEVNEEVFSGGGAAIAAIRQKLRQEAATAKISDLLDPKEPENSVTWGKPKLTEKEKDSRRLDNLMLSRSGSSLGGASVFFG